MDPGMEKYHIQLCSKHKLLEAVIKQICPNVEIELTTQPDLRGDNKVIIAEIYSAAELISYMRYFENALAQIILIIPNNLAAPKVYNRSMHFIKQPININDFKKILIEGLKRDRAKLGKCILDGQSKSIIVAKDNNIKAKIRLTNKEFAIIFFLSEAAETVSKKDILKTVFCYNELSDTNTVDVHLHRLKQKLSAYVDITKYIKE